MDCQKLPRMVLTKSKHLEHEIRPNKDFVKTNATDECHNYGKLGLGKDDAVGLETQKIRQLEEENKHMKEELAKLSIQRKPTSIAVKINDEAEEETIAEIIPVEHQSGSIPEADRWKLQRHTDFLVNELDAIELINKLYSQFVFDDDEYALLLDILDTRGRYRCITRMLMILRRKGPHAYIQFLLALERCNYTWVIQRLEPDCVIYEGKIKYSGQKFYELLDNTSSKYKEFVKRCENNIEQVYQDKPGQQFVVVKKLEKGCVEVTFHLISLGATDDDGLHRCLQDVIESGFIGPDPVKPDAFSFNRITDEQIAEKEELRTSKRINNLEKELDTLKSKINDLEVENAALKSASVHSTAIEKYKEHESRKYADNFQEQLDQLKTDNDKLQSDYQQLRHENEKHEPDFVTLETTNKKISQQELQSDQKRNAFFSGDESVLTEHVSELAPLRQDLTEHVSDFFAPFHQDLTYTEFDDATFRKEVAKWRSFPDPFDGDIPCSSSITSPQERTKLQSIKPQSAAGGPHLPLQQEQTNIRHDHTQLEQQLNTLESLHTTILQTLTKLQSESDYHQYGSVLCDYLMTVCDRRKIIRNKKFLLSNLQNRIQPLVEVLSAWNVLNKRQRMLLTFHIHSGDSMKATSDLLNILTDDPDPSLFNQFIQSLHELDLSHVTVLLNRN